MKYFSLIACVVLSLSGACTNSPVQNQNIDRFALVNRHNVLIREADPLAPVSVGNGDFAFTADVTGMQSFEDYYYENGIPLETLSSWAWHSFPNTENLKLEDAMKDSDFHGRKVAYASLQHSPAGDYFRKNPHPIPMGQISLVRNNGEKLELSAIANIEQHLDLWKGLVSSTYTVDGEPVQVETVAHPELSLVAFKIKSPLLKSGKIKPAIRFPYSHDQSVKNKPPFDWSKPEQHNTVAVRERPDEVVLKRSLDDSLYFVNVQWQGNAKWKKEDNHKFLLDASGADSLVLVVAFSPEEPEGEIPSFAQTREAGADSWQNYWTKGGAIDLSGSTDPRAAELERRIILSQYLVKVNYAGSFPPQETGLAHISWYGKHNSEVYWIHSAQFYQWNRTELLEKGLQWYKSILPVAKKDAENKGFDGVRWPKMAGPNGRPSPGTINPFIIWNQPNPIYLSELVYRAKPGQATLQEYSDLVFESAEFLASYAFYDKETDRYILGPPIKSVNESTEENNTKNPGFELAQWYHGLMVAQQWRERLGMEREPLWDDIMKKLARLTIQDGKYVEIETDPDMYKGSGGIPSHMLLAYGYLPKTEMVDEEVMERTFKAVLERNGLNSFVSWSLGKGALTAARLGEQETAVNIVTNTAPNAVFHKSGYAQRPKEPMKCPAYLPINSSFLAAVALMAGGWDGAPPVNAPGFPQDGSWKVRVEGLNKLP